MATFLSHIVGNAAGKLAALFQGIGIAISDDYADAGSAPTIEAGSGAPSATRNNGSLYLRTNGTLYQRTGGSWVAYTTGATGSIADTNTYYTTDTINGALDALALQIGGTSDAAYNFTNGTGSRLTDNDAVYAALNKLDQGFVDLKSTANAKGASLVSIEDSASLITATTVEGALAELVARLTSNTIADPGNAGAIPVTRSGNCALTSAGAETRTLAIPSFAGQRMLLYCDTYVGNIVITAAQPVNQAGNTILTFGAARDNCELVAITVGAALRWQVAYNDGVALS